MGAKRRYYVGFILIALSGTVLFLSSGFIHLYVSFREVIRIGNATMDALISHDSKRLLSLTNCSACAKRIEQQWALMERTYGKTKQWRFYRVGRVVEFGHVEPTRLGIDTTRFEIEYRVSFERLRKATIVVEVVGTEREYRLQSVRLVREINAWR